MSSYMIKAKDKETGKEYAVVCIDDYFGRHCYGYRISEKSWDVLPEEQFRKQYEQIEENKT